MLMLERSTWVVWVVNLILKMVKDLIARITDSSVYLKENGLAQAIQQVDLNIEDIISTMTF